MSPVRRYWVPLVSPAICASNTSWLTSGRFQ